MQILSESCNFSVETSHIYTYKYYNISLQMRDVELVYFNSRWGALLVARLHQRVHGHGKHNFSSREAILPAEEHWLDHVTSFPPHIVSREECEFSKGSYKIYVKTR